MSNLAVFASGSGTNAQRLAEYFSSKRDTKVRILLTNRKNAGVIERMKQFDIPVRIFDRKDFYDSDNVLKILSEEKTDWIILAGFLWLAPTGLIEKYRGKIINIHPALLPKYGGKGMYGMNVHEAVIKAGEKESGVTIHFVNEEYDSGDIIFQAKTPVDSSDTPETLAKKIHELEYKHFPAVIDRLTGGQ